MPEIKVSIGGREYDVACQVGEENFLRAAAAMLDAEAAVLGPQSARLPESRVLLMAGLMLADKTAGMDDQVREMQARLADRDAEIEELRAGRGGQADPVEVAVLPGAVLDMMSALAARAESLADEAEERASA